VAVDIWENNQWKELATATSIGANRLIRLPQNVSTRKVRLRITGADACIALSDFGLFKEPAVLPAANSKAMPQQGLSKKGWKVKIVDSSLVVDLGQLQTIRAFTYLPRQDKQTAGVADQYAYFTSTDGVHWTKAATGEFANIAANPIVQETRLDRAVQARYIKLTALHVISGSGVSVAELGVLTK
jgi:alpha-L-fucosidase